VAQYLLSKGYANVYALKGGWDDWLTAGFPVDSK
jgi:rhodanese-related sulfurtransferase